jgi:serine/threonine protein kinase
MQKSDFKPTNILGKGSFGKVFKAIEKQTGHTYAIKVIEKHHILKLKMINQIKNEINILEKVDHENIVKMYTYFEVLIYTFKKQIKI